MAKVLLVQSVHIYKHHTHLQPLGIMYLASAIREKGHDVQILDMKVEKIGIPDFLQRLEKIKPDVLGITAMTYEAKCMLELATEAKKAAPDMKIVAGGAHAANMPEETLQEGRAIDCVVIGEGEETFAELLTAYESGSGLAEIRGLAYRENGDVRRTEPRPFIEDLDAYPFPAWDLIPVEKYFDIPRGGIIFHHREFMTLFSSRSCPYKCIYCHRNLGKGYRPRRPDRVVDEIETLYRNYGIREFEFMDDMFNLKKDRVQAICRLILERNLDLKMTFPNGMRADILDVETLKLLKEAGMYRTMLAIESGSPRLQKYIKKHVQLDKAQRIIKETVKLGIMTHGAFMLGFPTETEEEMRQTIRFAHKSAFHTAAFYRVLPFPGSELYEMVMARQPDLKVTPEQFEYHSSDMNLSEVSEEMITKLRKRAYVLFYLNPVRLFRIFYRLPNKSVLLPKLLQMFMHRAMER